MHSSVRIEQHVVRASGLSPHAGLPQLDSGGGRVPTQEERDLLGVGPDHAERPPTVLPYTSMAAYDRTPQDQVQRVAVLANEHLRATFLLDLGGRLWELTDLDTGRELLHQADWVQQANLGLRNAWFAGGVEWNLGVTGHWNLTSEPISAAVVEQDGVQVLRMWAYERMLELVWRLDVWLPAGATALAVHVTLTNPHETDRPVYWWSNIAVPQSDGGRVLVDADSAMHFGYSELVHRVPIPVVEGVDVTRPALAKDAGDYFFETHLEHPWITAVGPDGYGLAHASTRRLVSRKLFVWGTGTGGAQWQQWLSGTGSYLEIQAGLARTQLEHLRLPAGQTWSWTETYRAVQTDPELVAGEWDRARAEGARVSVDEDELEHAHQVLSALAGVPVVGEWSEDRGARANQGWGALAVTVGDLSADPATPFDPGCMDQQQRSWLEVARGGQVPDTLVDGVVTGEGWLRRLRQAEPSPVQRLLLGYAEHAAGKTSAARALWQRSVEEQPSAAAMRALALTSAPTTEVEFGAAADLLADAHELLRTDTGPAADQLLVEWLTLLHKAGRPGEVVEVIDSLGKDQREHPRVAYLECAALIALGQAEAARRLLDRPLVLPDLREGDLSLDALWEDYQRLVGGTEPLPAHYDFRMFGEHPEAQRAEGPAAAH